MRKTRLLSILFFVCCIVNAFSQTNIAGGNVSGTWTLAGSPYQIQGSIMIPNDSTLTIQPGVTVSFQSGYKLYVKGRLLAVGSATDTITFTTADTNSGWRGIRFDNTTANNDSSKFIYCKLQYGKANGSAPDDNGGAFYFKNFSKAVISHSRIHSCYANAQGGGIYIDSGNPIISDNIITNNSSLTEGGGIYFFGSPLIKSNVISYNSGFSGGGIFEAGYVWPAIHSPTIINNTISNNSSPSGSGGGICINDSALLINNIISSNSAMDGGGIYVYITAGIVFISNNVISNNIAAQGGGGITCKGKANINNNTIFGNVSNYQGGGIWIESAGFVGQKINNNFICNNLSDWEGGGIYFKTDFNGDILVENNLICNNWSYSGGGAFFYVASPILVNNTMANNGSVNCASLFCTNNSSPILRNCILWGNTASSNGAQVYLTDEQSDPDFYYCDIEGGLGSFYVNSGFFYTGIYQNNVNANPLFVSPTAGSDTSYNGLTADWSLQLNSPCVDNGDPAGTYPATDIAGNLRVVGAQIDMGAYEYQTGGGVSQLSFQNDIIVFPNPNSGIFTIKSTVKISSIEIINMLGESIFKKTANSKLETVNLNEASKGIYFYRLLSEKENIATGKLMIE